MLWVSISIKDSGMPGHVNIGSPITFEATFNKPVYGFTSEDIVVTNGHPINFVGSDGDSVYTFDVVPDAIGEVLVEIEAGAAQDVVGNVNPAPAKWSLGVSSHGPKGTRQVAQTTPIPDSSSTQTPEAVTTLITTRYASTD